MKGTALLYIVMSSAVDCRQQPWGRVLAGPSRRIKPDIKSVRLPRISPGPMRHEREVLMALVGGRPFWSWAF